MRRPYLTETEVKSLSLFDELCSDAMASSMEAADELLSEIWSSTKDPRRHVPRKMRATAYNRDRGQCRYCGVSILLKAPQSWMSAQADHVIPHSRGGKTVLANIWTACGPCNRSKTNKVW
ncbi:MAG: HNH endonuclease [Roseibacillus sp.]|nr:HNH endonuclease [Roseibacillus sp.]